MSEIIIKSVIAAWLLLPVAVALACEQIEGRMAE